MTVKTTGAQVAEPTHQSEEVAMPEHYTTAPASWQTWLNWLYGELQYRHTEDERYAAVYEAVSVLKAANLLLDTNTNEDLVKHVFEPAIGAGLSSRLAEDAIRNARRFGAGPVTKRFSIRNRPKRDGYDWLVEGVVKPRGLTMFYGEAGSLKSMLAADLVASVVVGDAWLPPLPDADTKTAPKVVRQGRVLWFDNDMGEFEVGERLAAMLTGHDGNADTTALDVISYQGIDFEDAEVIQSDIKCSRADLVIFDVFKNFLPNGLDENSSAVADSLSALREVANNTGAAILLIHHSNKSGKNGLSAMRGSTAIAGSVDTAYQVLRNGDKVTLKATKSRSAPGTDIEASFAFDAEPGGMLQSARFYGVAKAKSKTEVAADFVLEALQNADASTATLIAQAKEQGVAGRDTIRTALGQLQEQGRIQATTGAHNAKTWRLKLVD